MEGKGAWLTRGQLHPRRAGRADLGARRKWGEHVGEGLVTGSVGGGAADERGVALSREVSPRSHSSPGSGDSGGSEQILSLLARGRWKEGSGCGPEAECEDAVSFPVFSATLRRKDRKLCRENGV